MARVAVQPLRTHHGPRKGVELLAAEAVDAASTTATEPIYIIQPVTKLPTINVTHTLAGVIAGRRHARAVDTWITRLAARFFMVWYVNGVVFTIACAAIIFIEDYATISVLSALNAVLMVPMLSIQIAALCWDMLVLLAQTFDFWFLILFNVANITLWVSLLADVRNVGGVLGGICCALTVFLDANLHMRLLVLRLIVVGAFGLLFITVMANLHILHHLVYTSIHLGGTDMTTVDAVMTGGFTIGYFMLTRAFRYRAVVFSCGRDTSDQGWTTTTIQCDIYFPVCRLVPYNQWNKQRRMTVMQPPRLTREPAEVVQLELVERDQLRIIDARDTIVRFQSQSRSSRIMHPMAFQVLRWMLNAIGVAGAGIAIYLSGQEVLHSQGTTLSPADQLPQWHIAAFVATVVFVLIHATYFQRELFRRICFEIDAWFVSFMASLVAISACDIFKWDRRSLIVATAWLWSHWMLFLDALPPVMRTHLALARVFIVFVSFMLLVFPLWLGYMILFASNVSSNRNRTFQTRIGRIDVQFKMISFVLSRIFTLWVWMGRFFWRELLRPRDSFKLIKYRVQFPLG